LVLNYVGAIGVKEVGKKILSRSRESFRNDKCFSVGLGKITEAPEDGSFSVGDKVLFLATRHPPCVERIVLPGGLIASAENVELPTETDKVLHLSNSGTPPDRWWGEIKEWASDSGSALPVNMEEVFSAASNELQNADWDSAKSLPVGSVEPKTETEPGPEQPNQKSAVLFGYGQYAKTLCLPNIQLGLNVRKIHEIDTMQLPVNLAGQPNGWSTRGEVTEEDDYDVFVVAGYHHTHAEMAVKGLNQGASVIVEKPLAVNFQQLEAMTDALEKSDGSLFSCFQRRYWRYNEWVREDLQLKDDTPLNYFCIIYQIMLPDGHWYRWPNSCSRIVSNGCHWLDHFLYLNNYCNLKTMLRSQWC